MFVKSSMGRDVKYSKSTGAVLLKANTITYVDDNLVTAKELKDCYGNRITIMSKEVVDQYIGELANTGNPEVDDFLNGVTDELPEGTQEIDEEEALRLQKIEEEKKAAEEAKRLEEERKAAEEAEAILAAQKAEEERLAAEAKAREEAEKLEALKAAEAALAAKKAEEEKAAKEAAEAAKVQAKTQVKATSKKAPAKSKGKTSTKKK